MPVETTAPLLGRCKADGCNFALFATNEDVREAQGWKDVQPGLAYYVNNGFFGRCPNGHKVFALKRVKGTYSPDHKCDARCLNARGHSCTCSCGGANHGRGHIGAVVEARDPADKPLSHHIGQVGAFIRGTATITKHPDRRNEYGAPSKYRKPYEFETDEGNVIVWWLPDFIDDPEYSLGQRVTFRAKVKDHIEYNNRPQTRVTHLEEIGEQS